MSGISQKRNIAVRSGSAASKASSAVVEERLEGMDLIAASKGGNPDNTSDSLLKSADLSATVGAFQGRIRRKKKEKKQELSLEEEAARSRHALMLEAILNVRKSLVDVERIDLGERFCFELDADDYHGWPRITLRLIDDVDIKEEYPVFQLRAHDRNSKGTLELLYGEPRVIEQLQLARSGEIRRLPAVLKKSVREYLDLVADIVIQKEQEAEKEQIRKVQSEAKGSVSQESSNDNSDVLQIKGDFFEENTKVDVFESLPALDDLDVLEVKELESD